jgi:hypothetical protein
MRKYCDFAISLRRHSEPAKENRVSSLPPAIQAPKHICMRAQRLLQRLRRSQPPGAPAPPQVGAPDRIALYAALQAHGLACPRVAALFNCAGRTMPAARTLHGAAEAQRYLRDAAVYPLRFVPLADDGAAATLSAIAYENHGDAAVLGHGTLLALADLVALLELPCARGYLLQELPSAQRPGGLRVTLALSAHGPRILCANGTQAGPGIPAPLWKAARRLVLSGAALFPLVHRQHWHIALSERGPLAMAMHGERKRA